MTKAWKQRAFRMAAGLAVLMHLLLFVAVRPADGKHTMEVRVPPKTYYRNVPTDMPPGSADEVRMVWSPVLFSLPSPLGFSRDLLRDKLSTRLTFAQPGESETFLSINLSVRFAEAQLISENLMLTAGESRNLSVPPHAFQPESARPPIRRVHVVPALKERLEGGIVLPPELSQPGGAAWEIQADVHVSAEGIVQYIFLEQPLEEAALNQSVLQLLRGLRFRSGSDSVDGRIEIYSAAAPAEGETP